MTGTRAYPYFLRIATAGFAAWTRMASEYHGTVTTSDLPVPGVTVTAAQSDRTVVTTADERGRFTFGELDRRHVDACRLAFAGCPTRVKRHRSTLPLCQGTTWFGKRLIMQDAYSNQTYLHPNCGGDYRRICRILTTPDAIQWSDVSDCRPRNAA